MVGQRGKKEVQQEESPALHQGYKGTCFGLRLPSPKERKGGREEEQVIWEESKLSNGQEVVESAFGIDGIGKCSKSNCPANFIIATNNF